VQKTLIDPMAVPLDVDGQVSVLADDGAEILVRANGSLISIQLPNLWVSHRLMRKAAPRRLREQLVAQLQKGAVAADLEVKFTVADRLVAELDTRSRGSVLARWLGLGPIKLHPMTLLTSLFKKSG